MSKRLIVFITFMAMGTASAESLDDFKARIEAALAQPTEDARARAVEALYHKAGTDEQTAGFIVRAAGMLGRSRSPAVSFEPLNPDRPLVNVRNGYEYRPNLQPLGYVRISGSSSGSSSKLPYGRHEDRYMLPATVRRLVNPDAKPDITLQVIAVGMASPPLTFEGWCDVELSDGSIRRRKISDNGVGNSSLAFHAQAFKACEVTNTAGRGSLSLKLIAGKETVFENRVEHPERTIRFN